MTDGAFVCFVTAFGQQKYRLVNIGRAATPLGTVMALQPGSPIKLKLLGAVKCKGESHALSIETFAHNIFAGQRHRDNWFKLSRKHFWQMKRVIAECKKRGMT